MDVLIGFDSMLLAMALRPFRSDESHLFFGREDQSTALLQLLRKHRFLAVVGTSGNGKSSLVRAGLIPELHGGTMAQAGSAWEILILRPGGSPFLSLAQALIQADLYDPDDPGTLPRLRATLSRSRYGLVEAIKQSDLIDPDTNVLIVVDQFEELFRFRKQGLESDEAAGAFVNLLLTASSQSEHQVYITVTMRSDYLGDCSEIPGLAEAVNNGEYLIPRLQRDQKQDAIVKPVGVGGAKIDPLLVQRLLNDVGDDADQLPVLQHALMRMWDVWAATSDRKRPIDLQDLEATGGLTEALSRHADEVYHALPGDEERGWCRGIFEAITIKESENRGIRSPQRLSRLSEILEVPVEQLLPIIDAFRCQGVTFLMPSSEVDLDSDTVIDISHESLMRVWVRLRHWVEEEAQAAGIYRRVAESAILHTQVSVGLYRAPELGIALSWLNQSRHANAAWAERYHPSFEDAISFLEKSREAAEAAERTKEATRQRELEQARGLAEAERQKLVLEQRTAKRLRFLLDGVAVVATLAAMAWMSAVQARKQAVASELLAKRNADVARAAQEQADESASRLKEILVRNDFNQAVRSAQDGAASEELA